MEEFSTSNFFGITKDGTYVTPKSPAVLPSITNKSLMQLAEAKGRKVKREFIQANETTTTTKPLFLLTSPHLTPSLLTVAL